MTVEQNQMILDWLWTTYYGNPKYSGDLWFQWAGKPLLLAFDPMRLSVPIAPNSPISFTVRNCTGQAKATDTQEEGWQWLFGPPQAVIEGTSSDGVAFVYPRVDEAPAKQMGATYITWPPRSIDPLLTECAYERQWQELVENPAKVRLIVLYAWNLYGEQAYIEPAGGAPPRPSIGHAYVDRTREYYQAFLEGRPVTFGSQCSISSSSAGTVP